MRSHRPSTIRTAARLAASALGLAGAAYATYAAVTWLRYGRSRPPRHWDRDDLLDHFMHDYEVVERHWLYVRAPAAITFQAATDMDLERSPVVRAIFRTREFVLRAEPDNRSEARGLLSQVLSMGWGVLAEIPDREIVVGAVTRPWEGNVTFRALPPDEFASFNEPDYVKIVWTLRADPIGDRQSVFRTETRARATDAEARRKFRLYWSAFSPGIWLIRWLSLGPLRRDAEARARMAFPRPVPDVSR
jgi:hypothetical protein